MNVEPMLSANQEKLRLTSQGQLAGIRRVYDNSAQRTDVAGRMAVLCIHSRIMFAGCFCRKRHTGGFHQFLEIASKNASVSSISVGGTLGY